MNRLTVIPEGLHRMIPQTVSQCRILVLLLLVSYQSISAQLQILQPVFNKISGAVIWGSTGYESGKSAQGSRPVIRGGFAVLYGPFYINGLSDTVYSVADTSIKIKKDTIKQSDDTLRYHVHVEKSIFVDSNQPGGGHELILATGYEFSDSYRKENADLDATIPVGGIYFGAFMNLTNSKTSFFRATYVGLTAGVFSLSDVVGKSDNIPVKFSSETVIAPEVYLGFSTVAHLFFDVSYQYIKFASVKYSAAYDKPILSEAAQNGLSSELDMSAFHLTLGLSISAHDLFPGK